MAEEREKRKSRKTGRSLEMPSSEQGTDVAKMISQGLQLSALDLHKGEPVNAIHESVREYRNNFSLVNYWLIEGFLGSESCCLPL